MSTVILIACRYFPCRFGLEALSRKVLGSHIHVDFAANTDELSCSLSRKNYDILICDTVLKGINNFALVEKVLSHHKTLKILIASITSNAVFASRYYDLGAFGYVCTDDNDELFKRALHNISNGRKFFYGIDDTIAIERERMRTNNPFDLLSKREFVVMMQLLQGKYIKEIAANLSLGLSTVSTYRIRILKKLKVKTLVELSMIAREYNLLIPYLEQ